MHWQQTQQALKAKKPVLVANPLVTDATQLAEFNKLINDGQSVPVVVDFHRAWAPFIQKIKEAVSKRRTPMIIQYRMNNTFMSKEQLFQSFGAGRVIGQAAHAIDLFCYLTDAAPRSISVESLYASRSDIFPTDNFSAQISFDDGSVCSLVFTTLGHQEAGAERMELFYDQKTIVMDDWQSLYGFGFPSWFNETVTKRDLGEYAFLQALEKHFKQQGLAPLIPLHRLSQVSELTLLIDQLVCEGGGQASI